MVSPPILAGTPLPLPMGEVAERERGRRGSTLKILMDILIQNKRPKALSVSAAPSQLSQRESQGRGFDCTRKDGTIPDKSQTRSSICHSDRSISGVEKSSTLDNEPTQDKIYNLRGFLDSLCSQWYSILDTNFKK